MKNKYLVIGGAVAVLGGLAFYAKNQFYLIDKLNFKVTGYDIITVSKEGARVDLKMSIENTGVLKLKIKKVKLNVFAENKFMATVYSDKTIEVNPNQTGEFSIQILLNPKFLLKNIGSIISTVVSSTINSGNIDVWKNIGLTIDGSISISKGGIPFWLPIKYGFKLSDFTADN